MHQEVPVSSSNTEKEDALVQSFILASKTGNFDNFISMLTDDAILIMDGGGKVRGALHPIISRYRILALFKGIAPKGYFEGNPLPIYINNQRGVLLMRNDQPVLAIYFG